MSPAVDASGDWFAGPLMPPLFKRAEELGIPMLILTGPGRLRDLAGLLESCPDLVTDREIGPPVRLLSVSSEMAEGIAVVREISRMVGGTDMLQSDDLEMSDRERGRTLDEFAVLFRTACQADVLEECFLREGLPYRVVGQKSFLEASSVR